VAYAKRITYFPEAPGFAPEPTPSLLHSKNLAPVAPHVRVRSADK
jgi:hypothetical protein